MTEKDVRRMSQSLLALQKQYMDSPRDSDERNEAKGYHDELCTEMAQKARRTLKYSVALARSQNFYEALSVTTGELVLPVLAIVEVSLKYHSDLPRMFLMKESQDLLSTLIVQINEHALAAYSVWSDDIEQEKKAALYSKEEGSAIISSVVNIFARLLSVGGQQMLSLIAKRHPNTADVLTRCASVYHSKDLSKLTILFVEENELLEERKHQDQAAAVVQANWRGFLARRKWDTLKNGFNVLQKCYRKRLKLREISEQLRFDKSERQFEEEFNALVERRRAIEERFEQIMRGCKEEASFPGAVLSDEKAAAQTEPSHDVDASAKDETDEESKRRDWAATVIQTGVRRWLIRKRNRRPLWARPLMESSTLTETRVRRYQDEIELWQQKNKIPSMTVFEAQDLQHKAYFMYARFSQGLSRKKMQQHKTLAAVAAVEAMVEVTENAPKLQDYDSAVHKARFHSLPLHVATKARLDHKEQMKRLEMPRWTKLLEEYG